MTKVFSVNLQDIPLLPTLSPAHLLPYSGFMTQYRKGIARGVKKEEKCLVAQLGKRLDLLHVVLYGAIFYA